MRPAGWYPDKRKAPKTAKAKRRKPLPSWLAAAILLGALALIGIIFAVRLSHAGYEGPDIYPEFRALKKEYMALEQKKAAEAAPATKGTSKPRLGAVEGENKREIFIDFASLNWGTSSQPMTIRIVPKGPRGK